MTVNLSILNLFNLIEILAAIFTILGFILKFRATINGVSNALNINSTRARKEFLGQIRRGNDYVSSFYKQINPSELDISLLSLADRTFFSIFFMVSTIITSIIMSLFIPNFISYVPLAISSLLFVFAFFSLLDIFSLFMLKKDGKNYTFTSLKETVSKLRFIVRQSMILIAFTILAFFISLLSLNHTNPLSTLSHSIYISVISIVLILLLAVVIIWRESNIEKELLVWAFSKYIDEEDARIKLIVALKNERVSGYLSGIGTNLELKFENGAHREIPWKAVESITVDKNVKCIQTKTESIDDFFLKLKGKRIILPKPYMDNLFRIVPDYGLYEGLLTNILSKLEEYAYNRISPELIDYAIGDWIINNYSGQRFLVLKPDRQVSGIEPIDIKLRTPRDLVFIDHQESKTYKIMDLDLKKVRIGYKVVG